MLLIAVRNLSVHYTQENDGPFRVDVCVCTPPCINEWQATPRQLQAGGLP